MIVKWTDILVNCQLIYVKPCLHRLRDLFATDFFATDWRSMRFVKPFYAHIRIEDYNRRLVGDRFATGLRLIGDWSPCLRRHVCNQVKPIGDQSATTRRPVGDQSATGLLNLLTQMAKRTECCMSCLKPRDIETNPRSVAD